MQPSTSAPYERLLRYADSEALERDRNQNWYVLQVCPRREKWIADALRTKEYQVCLPLNFDRRQWSDRRKIVEVPVFPGYIFCEFDSNLQNPILETPGVFSILRTGRKPTPLEPDELQALRVLERAEVPMEPWPYLAVGDRVVVVGGVLDSLTGVLQNVKKVTRVVISVNLLQRAVSVEVPREFVKPLDEPLNRSLGRSLNKAPDRVKIGPVGSRQSAG